MKEIVIASTNQGKIKEIKAMLNEIGIEVSSIQDVFDKEILKKLVKHFKRTL